MYSLNAFHIDLKTVVDSEVSRSISITDEYFEAIDAPQVRKGTLTVSLTLRKTAGCYECDCLAEGVVCVPCDKCLDDMELPIQAEDHFVVKLGAEPCDDGDLVVVDECDGVLDLSWRIYESIALQIPIRHVHETGKCNAEMLKVLDDHAAARSSFGDDDTDIDPRWKELEKLKTIKD